MDFVAVVDQVIALLRQRGRVAYRTLQRQFQLDDDALHDLKEELLYAHPEVHDDAGRGVVWTGVPPATEPDTRSQAEAERHLYTVLPAVLALLQREQRVTYRTLRAVFGVDEACLHAVRDELGFRQLAREEGGQGLVWTGEDPPPATTTAAPPLTSDTAMALSAGLLRPPLPSPEVPRPLPGPTPGLDGVASLPIGDVVLDPPDDVAVITPARARSAPEAERRQLTVLFCDLVGSTDLSRRLDPEDLREVVRAYQETASGVIQRYAGHIAQYLGDGLLVYFGYPLAHEDDARRAVSTGLGIVDAMASVNTRLETDYGVCLAVRLGIHTGPVVVGQMGGGERHEHLALGDTPNIAARLEGLAAPNTVVISPMTARLLADTCVLTSLGPQTLKGVEQPMEVWTVRGLRDADPADEPPVDPGSALLVGRDEELGLLRRRWEQSKEGLGQVVLITGEAGIGKSSLVRMLHAHVRLEGAPRLTFRCSPYHANSALYPVITHLQQRLQMEREDAPEVKLAKLEHGLQPYALPVEDVVPLLAALLSIPLPEGRYPVFHLSPQQQRQQTLDALQAWLLAEAERHPTLVLWEDLHWADPTTLELLDGLVEQVPTAALLSVLTCRPAFVPSWPARAHLTPLTLNRLERPQVEALITHVARGKHLPPEVVTHIVSRADGVPLYVEELTRALLESTLLQEQTEHYRLTGPLTGVAIPATLQDALMARLDRLPIGREVAQLGAVLGREFAYEMLQALAGLEEERVQAGLAQLVDAELLYQRGRPPRARYIFKHALVHDVAYQSILRRTRQHCHQQVAQLVERRFLDLVETEPELVAHHYTAASCPAQAIPYWQQAGARAHDRAAFREAVAYLDQALQALASLPEDGDTRVLAIELRLAVDLPLIALGEYGRRLALLGEAEALARALGDRAWLGRVLTRMTDVLRLTGDPDGAIATGQQALALATEIGESALQEQASHNLGQIYYDIGAFGRAAELLRRNVEAVDRESSRSSTDVRIQSQAWLARTLGTLGGFAEGRRHGEEALHLATLAGRGATPITAHAYLGELFLAQGDLEHAIRVFDQGLALCRASGYRGGALRVIAGGLGSASALQGRLAEGRVLLEEAISEGIHTGGWRGHANRVARLSEICRLAGCGEEAGQHARQALDLARQHKERANEALALHQLGVVYAHADPADATQAAAHYQQALALAEALGMRPLQAHCHRGLGTLYAATGQRAQARTEFSTAIEMYQSMAMTFWLPETEAALVQVEGR